MAANGTPRGAYGLRFEGSQPGLDSLSPVPAEWPSVRLEWEEAPAPPREGPQFIIGEHDARIRLLGGAAVRLERERMLATILAPAPLPADRILHPALGYIATVFSHWLGRMVFHGGAFSRGDGALAVLGQRGAGKSSTLAWLANQGCDLVADDVLVFEGSTVYAGPRSIDLWPETALALDLAGETPEVRGGVRQRFAPGEVPPQDRLRGWVSLAWGDEVRLRRLEPSERYETLIAQLHVHRAGHIGGQEVLLDLLTLPAFELTRPRRLDSLPEAGAALLGALGGESEGSVRDSSG